VDDAFIRYSGRQQSVVTKLTESHNRIDDVVDDRGREIIQAREDFREQLARLTKWDTPRS